MGQFSQILAMRLYAAGIAFVVTLLLSRLLGPSEFGAYVFAMGWVSILMLFATFGFHLFVVRGIPPLIVREEVSEAVGIVVFAAVFVTALAVLVSVIAYLNVPLLSADPSLQGAVAVAVLLLVPRAWNLLRTGVLQGLGRPIAGQVPERLVAPTLLVLALLLCLAMSWQLTARDVLWLTLATVVASLILGGRSLRRALSEIAVPPTFRNATSWVGGAAKSSLAFAAATVLGATDVIMLGMLSTSEETGVYGVAARFFVLMGLPFHAAIVHISQRAAKLNAMSDTDGLAIMARGAANRGFLAALALAVPSTIAAFYAEEIFGSGFGPATVPILILVWVRVLLSLAGQPGPILANTEFVGSVAITSVATVVINILLNALLIPLYGSVGAAIATSLSFVLMTIGHTAMLRHRLGISSFAGLPSRSK